jgi:hypothetical protein
MLNCMLSLIPTHLSVRSFVRICCAYTRRAAKSSTRHTISFPASAWHFRPTGSPHSLSPLASLIFFLFLFFSFFPFLSFFLSFFLFSVFVADQHFCTGSVPAYPVHCPHGTQRRPRAGGAPWSWQPAGLMSEPPHQPVLRP